MQKYAPPPNAEEKNIFVHLIFFLQILLPKLPPQAIQMIMMFTEAFFF